MNIKTAIQNLRPGDLFTREHGATVYRVEHVRAGQRYTEVEYSIPGLDYPVAMFHTYSLATVTVL